MPEIKTYRVYCKIEPGSPLAWVVDEGSSDTEQKVRSVQIMATAQTIYRGPGEEPRAYMACRGRLVVSGRFDAYIFNHDWRQ